MDAIPPKDLGCHRTGFEKNCHDLVVNQRCRRWFLIEGKHPVDGTDMKSWDCLDNHTVMLQLDMLRKLQNGFDGVQKATESQRNEIVKRMDHQVSIHHNGRFIEQR